MPRVKQLGSEEPGFIQVFFLTLLLTMEPGQPSLGPAGPKLFGLGQAPDFALWLGLVCGPRLWPRVTGDGSPGS